MYQHVSTPKRVIFSTVYLSIIFFVAFAILEFTARKLELAPPLVRQWRYAPNGDPNLLFRPKPFASHQGRNATDEFDYDYSYSSVGFRDVEHEWQKPGGTFRIFGLGDSFTHGAGVKFEESYLRRLEQMLNERSAEDAPVEIIKAGIGRYYPEAERLLLEHYGLRYEPDLILIGFLPNDVWDTHLGRESVTTDESGFLRSCESQHLGEIGRLLYLRSHLCRVFLASYIERRNADRYALKGSEIYRDGGAHEDDWLTLEAEYERMVGLAKGIGAKLAVIHIPQQGPWKDNRSYPAERLAAWAARSGAFLIDVLPAFKQASIDGSGLYYPRDGHCTATGHAVIADTLCTALTELGLVPGPTALD